MKRGIEQVASSTVQPPPMNRLSSVTSEMSIGALEEVTENSATFFLVSQNRALSQELHRNKRTISEARKELDLMRRKTREMESLVSLVQRAWSQLDIDTSMLLDSLGESIQQPAGGNTELLERLIHAGSKYNLTAPTNTDDIPDLGVDEWSSSDEINEARKKAHSVVSSTEVLDNEFGGPMAENLTAHAAFTLSLLERLCNAINESTDIVVSGEALAMMADRKAHEAHTLMLNDRIVKLSLELLDLKAELKETQNAKAKVEKKLDKALNPPSAAARATKRDAAGVSSVGVAAGSVAVGKDEAAGIAGASDLPADAPVPAIDPSVEKELKRQIIVLERQLAESESAKSHGEMLLTERLARPLAQTEGQVADMRKSMEELRQQCKTRVAQLLAENATYQEKVKSFENAVAHLEKETTARIEEVVSLTEKEIAAVRAERDAIRATYTNAEADIVMMRQLKAHMAELQATDAQTQTEMKRLQNELALANKTLDTVKANLQKSRAREETLTLELQAKITAATPSSSDESDESLKIKSVLAANEVIVAQSEARMADLQGELDDARNNINDLICEIDAVVEEHKKIKEQNTRLDKDITNRELERRDALEMNLKLQNQMEDMKNAKRDTDKRMEATKALLVQQDTTVQQLRAAEQNLRLDLQQAKKSLMEAHTKLHTEEQRLQDSKQHLDEAQSHITAAQKRNMELQSRCDELTSKCESERKQRLASEREVQKLRTQKKNGKLGNSCGGAGNDSGNGEAVDTDMLDMTLGMLRCSVCRDRFKSVVITRCFHLFCKECIDESLRNRHRKCPACGERFGQDDVRNIYFTH